MSTTARIIMFGVVSGLIWSLALSVAGEVNSVQEVFSIFVPGVLTGLLVSFALRRPLAKVGYSGTFVAGLLSLPVGAFVFGFLGTLIRADGMPLYR